MNDEVSVRTPQKIPFEKKRKNTESLISTQKSEVSKKSRLSFLEDGDLPEPPISLYPGALKLSFQTLYQGFFGFLSHVLLYAYVFSLAYLLAHAPSKPDINLSVFYITNFWVVSGS